MVMTANKLSEVQYDEARRRLRIWRMREGSTSPAVQFARYLAGKPFCIERVPDGFILGWQLALRDFRKKEHPDLRLEDWIDMRNDIWANFFVIAEVIFPPEFVLQIRQAYDQLRAQAKKKGGR